MLVLTGVGPAGTGMEETYQVTGALKHLPFGNQVALLTDARFSGVSTGACVGHIGPEGLAGGPIGKVLEGMSSKSGSTAGASKEALTGGRGGAPLQPQEGAQVLRAESRGPTSRPIPPSRKTPGSGPRCKRPVAAPGPDACTMPNGLLAH